MRAARSSAGDHGGLRPAVGRLLACPRQARWSFYEAQPHHPTGRILRRVARALACRRRGTGPRHLALYDARRRARMNDTPAVGTRHETQPHRAARGRGRGRAQVARRGAPGARSRGHAVRRLGRGGHRADRPRGPRPHDRRRPPGRRPRARADRRGRRDRVGPRDRAAARPRRRGLRRARRRARHLGLRRVQRPAGRPGVDRGHDPPLSRGRAAQREGRASSSRARAPRDDRARQGDPDGAPRHRRQDGVRAACAITPAPATAASSTWPRPSSTATRCCPRAPRRTRPRAGREPTRHEGRLGVARRRRARRPARSCARGGRLQARLRALPEGPDHRPRRGADVLRADVAVPGAAVRRGAAGLLRPAGAGRRGRELPRLASGRRATRSTRSPRRSRARRRAAARR